MKNFDLFLDESGSFKQIGAPSMVAGFICESGICDPKGAGRLLDKVKTGDSRFSAISVDPFHAMESTDPSMPDFITNLIDVIMPMGAKLVEFKNSERIDIVNSDITYLNVFAEGIVQLILQLLAETEDAINLNIIFAHRRDMAVWETESRYERIPMEQYETRIAERIILRLARLPEQVRSRCNWQLKQQDANKYKSLMIADAICFALRGGRRQFCANLRERISLHPAYQFTVIEHTSWSIIQGNIASGRLADAIYVWYSSDDRRLDVYGKIFNNQIITRLADLGSLERRLQLRSLSHFIDNLIWARNYNIANRLLDRIAKEFLPLMETAGISEQTFGFDIPFYRLTIATHQGDIAISEEQISICRAMLHKFAARWETLDYYLSYKIREAEQQKNSFDFYGAIETLNKIEKILNETVSLFHLIDELGDIGEEMRSNTMGKVLGSRLLARCYLLKQAPEQADLARKDSNTAIDQFQEDYNKERQYQYRAQIEYEAGQYVEALSWLGKGFGAPEKSSVAQVLRTILACRGAKVFGLMHYVRIMAECLLTGEELGREMYQEWGRQKADGYLKGEEENPAPIIFWKLGTSSSKLGTKSAGDYYDQAIRLSQRNGQRYTNRAMGLVMEAERIALLEPNMRPKGAMRKLIDNYNTFMAEPLPETMKVYYAHWGEKLIEANSAPIDKQKAILYYLTREVPVI